MSLQIPFLDIIIGLAATFLGLSIAVQIVQEAYKFLTSSKGRAYKSSLIDTLGPFARQLLNAEAFPDLLMRGPFQFTRLSPRGLTLPLGKEEIRQGLERILPAMIRHALNVLTYEVKYQNGSPQQPSPMYRQFLEELSKTEKGALEYFQGYQIANFLTSWGHKKTKTKRTESTIGTILPPETIQAVQILDAFRMKFLSHVDEAAGKTDRLNQNFDFVYKRRNLRQTFVIALLITISFNFSIEAVYQRINALTPEQIQQLASQTLEIYEKIESKQKSDGTQKPIPVNGDSVAGSLIDSTQMKMLESVFNILKSTDPTNPSVSQIDYTINWEFLKDLYNKGLFDLLRYFFGCLITTFFISFGAPFWNDILSSLFRIGKGEPASDRKQSEVKHG